MTCEAIKPNVNKVCTGDFNKRITIQYRSIAPVNSPDSNLTVGFTNVISCWAMIKTSAANRFGGGGNWIDGVNASDSVNTDFFIRWTDAVDFTREIWVLYNNTRFKVSFPDNIDKEDKIIKLRSTEKGESIISANDI